jgi:hypothetical protein
MNLEFKAAVIGMILGDGHLTRIDRSFLTTGTKGHYKNTNGQNSAVMINHDIKQKEYMLWKKKILEELTEVTYSEGTRKDGHHHVHIRTRNHPFYTKLRKRFYYSGRKTTDSHLIRALDDRGLAIWFMDDGCLSETDHSYSYLIATSNFNLTEHELIVRELYKRFGIEWRINNHAKGKAGQLYRLRLRNADTDKFANIISPFINQINCMKYKLGSHAKAPSNEGERHSLNPEVILGGK